MPGTYIIRAAIDAAEPTGIFARDLFDCGVNETIHPLTPRSWRRPPPIRVPTSRAWDARSGPSAKWLATKRERQSES